MKRHSAPGALPGDQRGFTLLEALVAISILSIGILAVCIMQTGAMRASNTAYNRSEASGIATALVECFQSLPYKELKATAILDEENGQKQYLPATASSGEKDDYTYYVKGDSSKLDKMMSRLITPLDEEGKVQGGSGALYTLKWAVQEERGTVQGETQSIRKNIRVFMNWETPSGENRLEYNAAKYPNMAQ